LQAAHDYFEPLLTMFGTAFMVILLSGSSAIVLDYALKKKIHEFIGIALASRKKNDKWPADFGSKEPSDKN
jgi:hypothetical protein